MANLKHCHQIATKILTRVCLKCLLRYHAPVEVTEGHA